MIIHFEMSLKLRHNVQRDFNKKFEKIITFIMIFDFENTKNNFQDFYFQVHFYNQTYNNNIIKQIFHKVRK